MQKTAPPAAKPSDVDTAKQPYKLWLMFINHTAPRPVMQHYRTFQRVKNQVDVKWKDKVQLAHVYKDGILIWKYNCEEGWARP